MFVLLVIVCEIVVLMFVVNVRIRISKFVFRYRILVGICVF